jgi:hypothetical protein
MNLTPTIFLSLAFICSSILASEGPNHKQELAKLIQTKIVEQNQKKVDFSPTDKTVEHKFDYYEYPGNSGKLWVVGPSDFKIFED